MWRFKVLEEGDIERNPRETEFFRLRGEASEALVREVIQNSLDAKRDEESKVKVRFTFGSVDEKRARRYFDGLIPHLRACNLFSLNPTEQVSFLTIEDFGTTGLNGNIDKDAVLRKGSNFYDFWWREGISEKRETRAGRWGLGKTAFNIASRIRTFYGYTVRHDDSKRLLMGKALLKTHYIDNIRYQYYGYFCGDDKYRPISDEEVIKDFCSKFSVSRDFEPGLSIIIPLPTEGINFGSILRSAIINYFYPIASNLLEVEIKDDGGHAITIERDSLIEISKSQRWVETPWEEVDVPKLLQFVFEAIDNPNVIDIFPTNPEKPEMTEEAFGNRLDDLIDMFNTGSLLTFKIHIAINKIGSRHPLETYFTIHIKKDPILKDSEEFWFRSGIRITEIQTLRMRPVYMIAVAEDPSISEFLGDAETPAHTDWKENTEGFKEKYQNAVRALRFIKKSATQIVSMLDKPSKEIRKDLLKEIFFVPVTQEDTESGPEDTIKETTPSLFSEPQLFEISQISCGFRVSSNPEKRNNFSLPAYAEIIVAYDTRKGDPFKQYESYDFDLTNDSLLINAKGCSILSRRRNKIVIKITSVDFDLKVTGFDPKRDLMVDVKRKEGKLDNETEA